MSAERKRSTSARRRAERRAKADARRRRWRCWWTWPLGHRYETADGRGISEAIGNSGGAHARLYCVGCGRPFGLLEHEPRYWERG